MSVVLTSPVWWGDLENAKSVFDDMSLVLMIKLKVMKD